MMDRRLLDLPAIERELIRRHGFAEFVRCGWHVLEPEIPLEWHWHLDAICEHLEAVISGEILRLVIAVPPGTMKSLLSSVFLPAYIWGPLDRPSYRAMFASYASTLSVRDSLRCRRLIESPWYQLRWGERFKLTGDQNTKTRFENNKTGFRVATSVGGTVTGDRGNLVVCDDLLDRRRAMSPAHRAEASAFFWETLPSRVNSLLRDAFIVIAQRLDEQDTIGEILKRAPERWEKLILPLEFDAKVHCVTKLGFRDPRTLDGENLHPARFPPEIVSDLKSDLGSYGFSAQYQQNPVPRGGGIIREAWLNEPTAPRYLAPGANPRMIVQSWDCASKPAEHNDPSACGTFGLFADRNEVWDVYAGRLEFPDLKRRAIDLYNKYRPHAVLIEDKDAGQQLLQVLRRETKIPVIAINPGSLDKATRLMGVAPQIEAGNLRLPDDAGWVYEYVTELTGFPALAHDDQVDMTSQFLNWLQNRRAAPKSYAPVSVTREAPRAA